MGRRLISIGAFLLYPAAIGAMFAAQAGAPYAWWFVGLFMAINAGGACWYIIRRSAHPKPEGYLGKFRRSDGTTVHVARMASGRLWVASDTQPPEEIGYVNGRELAQWQKLSNAPDG